MRKNNIDVLRRFAFIFGAIMAFVAATAGCGQEPATDLAPYGIDGTMQLPGGSTIRVEDFSGDLLISDGNEFQLRLSKGPIDLEHFAESVERNEVNTLVAWIERSDSVLHYESKIAGTKEFHFVMNLEFDGDVYLCKEDETEVSYSEDDIEIMMRACRSLRKTDS